MKITEKPWGQEELLEHNIHYVVKRLFMKKGHKCSLQLHREKMETVYVLSGRLRLYIGASADDIKEIILSPNEYITLRPNEVHRMEGVDDCYYLESSTPQLDDVVRLKDEYGRAK